MIPVSLLRQQLFCPRIPYFAYRLGIRAKSPLWVEQGIHHDNAETNRLSQREFRRIGIGDAKHHPRPWLESPQLGLYGRADLVLETEHEIVPVEYKISRPKRLAGTVMQLIAYGLLAEEKFGKRFRFAILLAANAHKPERLLFTDRRSERFGKLYAAMQNTMNSPTMPDSPATPAQCEQCEYLRYCNDRE